MKHEETVNGMEALRSFQHIKRSPPDKWLCHFCLFPSVIIDPRFTCHQGFVEALNGDRDRHDLGEKGSTCYSEDLLSLPGNATFQSIIDDPESRSNS